MADRPYAIGGLAMIGSYFSAWQHRLQMLADKPVIDFIRRTQMKQLLGLLKGKPIY